MLPVRRRRPRPILLLLLALIGPGLGLIVYDIARSYERARAGEHFARLVAEQAATIEGQIASGVETLHSLRAFFESSKEVTRAEFASFAAEIRARRPEIRALEWAPRVPEGGRAAHVERVRAEGFPTYQITEHAADGRVGPAARRADYFPVCYVEPYAGNEEALGFDLASERVRGEALDRARALREAVMTDPIVLVQEGADSLATLVVLAVGRGGGAAPAATAEAPAGFVVFVWRQQDLIEKALARGRKDTRSSMRLVLLDPDAGDRPLYRAPDAEVASADADGPWRAEEDLDVAGQVWHLIGLATPYFRASQRSDRPLLLGGLVFLLTQLLYVALVVRAARARDRSRREQAQMVGALLRSLDEGVVVADTDGRILLRNEAAIRMVGDFGDDLGRTAWSRHLGCFLPDKVTPYDPETLPLSRAMRGEHVVDEHVFIRNEQVPEGLLIRVSGAPLIDEANAPRGGVVVFSDVTEQERAQEHLSRLSNAVEKTADAVFISDRRGRLIYANPAFETVTGYASDEVMGKTPRFMKSGKHDEAFYADLWSTLLAGKVWRGTAINRRKCGDLFYSEQTITPMKDAQGEVTHFVAVCKDLTEKHRRMEHEAEMRLAGLVQQRLYPKAPPKFDGLEVAGCVLPAEATCGDYYDYIELPDGSLGLAIGDITGHGFGPALLMAETRAYLRSIVGRDGVRLSRVFEQLNQTLVQDLADEHFVTLLYARIDPRAWQITYVNAGHPAAYVLDRTGAIKAELGATGIALGILADRKYPCKESVALDEGDLLVFLTDGITEARSPEGAVYEEERVLDVVRANLEEPAHVILERLLASVRDFAAGRTVDDDQTMIICRVTADCLAKSASVHAAAVASGVMP